MLHQNIRGLSGKRDLLAELLFNHRSVDILGLSKTWTKPDSIDDLNIPGYNYERKDRVSGTGGGVGAFIKDGVPYIRRYDLENDSIEMIWLEICFKHTSSFFVGILYRPPDSSKYLRSDFDVSFEKSLDDLVSEDKEKIILGDINCDYLKADVNGKLKRIINSHGFKQLVSSPTRITDQSRTLTDIIATTVPVNIIKISTILSGLSDHDMVGCVRKINNTKYEPS